jgi:hypothetical protein
MAEGSTRTDKTVLEFAGRLDSSLSSAANSAIAAMGRVQGASTRASNSMSAGFARAGASAQAMGVKMRESSAIMAGAAGGAAVAAVMMAYQKGKEFFDAAIEASSDEKNALTSRKLLIYLQNIPELAKMGSKEIKAQAADISETAEKMQALSGTSAAVFKSGFANLVSFGGLAKGVEKIGPAMADFLAGSVGTKASFEDIADLSTKIGEAVTTGTVGRFGKLLGITPADAKAFKAMTSNAERLNWLGERIERRFRGQAASQGGSLGGQLLKAQTEQTAILASYGDVFRGIQLQYQTALTKMESAFLPIFKPVIEWISTSFGNIKGWIGDIISRVGASDVWQKWGKEIAEISSHFKGMGVDVQAIINWFVKWNQAGEVAKRIEAAMDATLTAVKTMGDVFNKIGEVWNGVIDGAVKLEQMSERIGRLITGHIGPGDTAAIVKDEQERAARGGHVGDVPGTFPNTIKEAESSQKRQTSAADATTGAMASLTLATNAASNALSFVGSGMGGFPIGGVGGLGDTGAVSNPNLAAAAVASAGMISSVNGSANLACAAAASKVLNAAGYKVTSTGVNELVDQIEKKGGYAVPAGTPGGVIYSPTGASHGHVGIMGPDGKIYSNSSATGKFGPSYTPASWKRHFGNIHEVMPKKEGTGGHTIGPTTININGPADKGTVNALKGALHDHTQEMLRQLHRANEESYRTSFA